MTTRRYFRRFITAEIQPCDGVGTPIPTEPDRAHFWTLYGRDREGHATALIDCNDEHSAYMAADLLKLAVALEARLARYERLHDGLSEIIEDGRLGLQDMFQDDYCWLIGTLAQCGASPGADTASDVLSEPDEAVASLVTNQDQGRK